MEKPILNEHGIQKFDVTQQDPHYRILYKRDDLPEIHGFGIFEYYGLKFLAKEFNNHMNYLAKHQLLTTFKIIDVEVHFQKKVAYRKNIEGEPYISYDWYKKSVNWEGIF